MVSDLSAIRHLLIDLDGVLYVGNAALPDARAFILWLRKRDITFRLVTNNATLTPEGYVKKLQAMDIEVREDEVFTSALATALFLRKQRGEQTAYVIGEEGLLTALSQAGVVFNQDRPDWVIVGLDRQVTYDKLATAALALQRGSRFLATNPDRSLPGETGLLPGAGAIQAALTATTGLSPKIIGKPEPLMLELATHQLGGSNADTAMLGDRLDTDIAAAVSAGVQSILVLTGVSSRDDVVSSPVKPEIIVDSLSDLMRRWSGDSRN